MGRTLGLLAMLSALTACGSSENNGKNGSASDGDGGSAAFGAGGTEPEGQGGTDPQGHGGTDSQGLGGTEQGQGGTMSDVKGDTDPPGPGGTTGEAGSAGAGAAGSAGDGAGGGAAGATAACEDQCEPCTEGRVLAGCDGHCICEAADEPLKPTYDDLLACNLDQPCPPSERHNLPGSSTWREGACLLTAFRDRTPGMYQHITTLADISIVTTRYTFLLGGDDNVLLLRTTEVGSPSGNLERTYLPVWSCTLRSYDDLDDCVAAGTDVSPSTTGGAAGVCELSQHWFETCETAAAPVCPGQ